MGGNLKQSEDRVEAWRWEIEHGDPADDDVLGRLEEMGFCVEEDGASFHVCGDHDKKPIIPDEVVRAVAMVHAIG